MYLDAKRTIGLRFLYGHIFRCVYTILDVGGRYTAEKELPYKYYAGFVHNMLEAKTALVNMLPNGAIVEEFDLIKNEDQDSDIAGTFKMSVFKEKDGKKT